MAVAVSSLGEGLAAVVAGEGSGADVGAHVVHHVAQLREVLAARQTLQHLVEAARFWIQILHLPIPFGLCNPTHVILIFSFGGAFPLLGHQLTGIFGLLVV